VYCVGKADELQCQGCRDTCIFKVFLAFLTGWSSFKVLFSWKVITVVMNCNWEGGAGSSILCRVHADYWWEGGAGWKYGHSEFFNLRRQVISHSVQLVGNANFEPLTLKFLWTKDLSIDSPLYISLYFKNLWRLRPLYRLYRKRESLYRTETKIVLIHVIWCESHIIVQSFTTSVCNWFFCTIHATMHFMTTGSISSEVSGDILDSGSFDNQFGHTYCTETVCW
jgi:hypothetical protein